MLRSTNWVDLVFLYLHTFPSKEIVSLAHEGGFPSIPGSTRWGNPVPPAILGNHLTFVENNFCFPSVNEDFDGKAILWLAEVVFILWDIL